MITRTLFALTLALAIVSTGLMYYWQDQTKKARKLARAIAEEASRETVELAVDPRSGDVVVRIDRQRLYGFPKACNAKGYF